MKNAKGFMRRRGLHEGGFTMIELIVVIVILGVLAATALPKFINLSADARAAAVGGMRASLSAASDLIRAKCIVTPSCNSTAGGSTVTVNGVSYAMYNGWLDAGDVGLNEIDKAITYDGFTLELLPMVHRFKLDGAKNPSACYAQYQEVSVPGEAPVISVDVSGC